MIFIDASAIVAILFREDDWEPLLETIERNRERATSPLAVWEAVIALARRKTQTFEEAEQSVAEFVESFYVRILPVDAATGRLALEASRRFGRGRHAADLNFGDCFAYASVRQHGLPLLFKGEDFGQTDIAPA